MMDVDQEKAARAALASEQVRQARHHALMNIIAAGDGTDRDHAEASLLDAGLALLRHGFPLANDGPIQEEAHFAIMQAAEPLFEQADYLRDPEPFPGLVCQACGYVHAEPHAEGMPFCGRCGSYTLRPATYRDIRTLPPGIGAAWLFWILLDAIGTHGAGREALASLTIDGNQVFALVGICLLVGWIVGWRSGRRAPAQEG